MKKFSFIAVFVAISVMSFSNNQYNFSLIGSNFWKINTFLCLDEQIEHYTLELHIENEATFTSGIFVEFLNDGTFISYNRPKCGTTIFKTITGTYFIENQILTINVDKIVINKKSIGGDIRTEYVNENYQFEIKQERNKVELFLINRIIIK